MVALSKMDRGLTTGARAMKPRRNPFLPPRTSAARRVRGGRALEVDGTREAPGLNSSPSCPGRPTAEPGHPSFRQRDAEKWIPEPRAYRVDTSEGRPIALIPSPAPSTFRWGRDGVGVMLRSAAREEYPRSHHRESAARRCSRIAISESRRLRARRCACDRRSRLHAVRHRLR